MLGRLLLLAAALLALGACEINDRENLPGDAGSPAGDGSTAPPPDAGPSTSPDATALLAGDAADLAPDAAAGVAAPRFIGRFDDADPARPRFGFSGSAVEARFSGTGVTLQLDGSDSDVYTAVVDGTATTFSTSASQQSYPLAQDLPAGEHRVLVWKNTEWFQGTGQFLGFQFVGGGSLLPVSAPARRLEFVGDSITCAYGNLGADQYCGFSSTTEDHYQGYAALTARALGADESTICQSGIGVWRNYDGATSGTMPDLYPLSYGDGPAWDFRSVPDAVLVNLGTNDWAQGTPDRAAFEAAYGSLLDSLRARYPQAFLLMAVGPMLGGAEAATAHAWLQGLADARGAAGDHRVSVVDFAEQDGSLGYGCDWHPSLATHQQMADHLVQVLQGLLGW